MSRQLDWQRRHAESGLCHHCVKPALKGQVECAEHALRRRDRQRQYQGLNRWEPGSPGRPPRWTDDELRRLAEEASK